jgi:membrane associated rhomboid family serine protease
LGHLLYTYLVMATASTRREKTRTGREFMFRHFTVSWMNLLQFRVWTLITSGFSQESLLHLATNMVTLWFLGDEVAMLLGRRRFRNFYLLSILFSSLGHLLYTYLVMATASTRREKIMAKNTAALGASGAVMAIAVFFTMHWPSRIIWLNFFIPVPALVMTIGFVLWDIFNATLNKHSNTSNMGHLGGALLGILYYLKTRRSLRY